MSFQDVLNVAIVVILVYLCLSGLVGRICKAIEMTAIGDAKISEFVFMFTVLLWPLLIIAGVIGLIMWLFVTAGDKIGEFLRRKFDEK